jgi:micrococcal nuclease
MKMKFINRSGLGVVLTCLILSNCSPSESLLPEGANGRIVKVIDGDTIDVSMNGHTERVRLIGIDTPETKKPDTPIECFGPEASDRTTELLPIGTPVLVQRDVEARDPYGRLLGYVYRTSDRLFVNEDLIVNGYARPLSIAPNTAFTAQFADQSQLARSSRTGLWGECPPEP